MNVHLLVLEDVETGTKSVEAFTSRSKMVSYRASLKGYALTMFPPIRIRKTTDDVMRIIDIINRIHTEGEIKILEELESEEEDNDQIEDIYDSDN